MRVGMGYDVHRLIKGRRLILAGVEIPHELGLLGHSDADVAVHAIMDALLGAAALSDIGKHFPDTDEKYAGISSLKLLEYVRGLLEQEHYLIENIDATIVAQKPKLRPYINEMEQKVAQTLRLSKDQVNIKATTEEGLDLPERSKALRLMRSVRFPRCMREALRLPFPKRAVARAAQGVLLIKRSREENA